MYPIADPQLPVSAIVRHWHRQIAGTPTENEVFGIFLHAFWTADGLFARATSQARDRWWWLRQFHVWSIKIKRRHIKNFHIFFGCKNCQFGQNLMTDLSRAFDNTTDEQTISGLDLRLILYLGFNDWESCEQWTAAEVDSAYEHLARSRIEQMPDMFVHYLGDLIIDRDDFKAWCQRNSWPLPLFWFLGESRRPTATAKAVSECRAWLAEQIARPQRGPKADYRDDAKARFSGLSHQAFNSLWDELAPDAWRRSGRRCFARAA